MNIEFQALRSLMIDPSSNYTALAAAIAAVVVLVLILVFAAVALILPGDRPKSLPDDSSNHDGRRRRLVAGKGALIVGLVVFGLTAAFVIWYQTTSSNEYCGRTCHAMAAPAATWKRSPHSSVACVRCHEGTGADALSGAVSTRFYDLYLNTLGRSSELRHVPAGRCLDCHSTVLDMPLAARNGEPFLHREALAEDIPCESCHGSQGHAPSRR